MVESEDNGTAATTESNAGAGSGCSRLFSTVFFAAVCALLSVLVFYTVYMFATAGPRLPEIDQAALDEARDAWRQNGPSDYNIEVAVTGPRAAVYRVEVRGGKATKALRDGDPLTDARTLGTWSVPGMFDTLQLDVDHIDKPIEINARESHFVSPRAEFNSQYGYPSRYRRIEWGSNMEAGWEVSVFEVVKPGNSTASN